MKKVKDKDKNTWVERLLGILEALGELLKPQKPLPQPVPVRNRTTRQQ